MDFLKYMSMLNLHRLHGWEAFQAILVWTFSVVMDSFARSNMEIFAVGSVPNMWDTSIPPIPRLHQPQIHWIQVLWVHWVHWVLKFHPNPGRFLHLQVPVSPVASFRLGVSPTTRKRPPPRPKPHSFRARRLGVCRWWQGVMNGYAKPTQKLGTQKKQKNSGVVFFSSWKCYFKIVWLRWLLLVIMWLFLMWLLVLLLLIVWFGCNNRICFHPVSLITVVAEC